MTQDNSELASWDNKEKLDLMRKTIASGVTNDEFELFIAMARSSGLDPFQRQIYAVSRGGKMTVQTGIDGYRLIADRTGKHMGTEGPFFEMGDKYPISAKVIVKKLVHGHIVSFEATCYWDEYAPSYNGKISGMWDKMGRTMLGKVAEALALRRGFPAQMSGIYTSEEMDQAIASEPKQEQSYKPKKSEQSPNTEILEAAFDVLDATQTLLDNAKIIAGSGQVALREWYSCLDKNQKNLIKDRMKPIAELAKEFDDKEDISNVDAT